MPILSESTAEKIGSRRERDPRGGRPQIASRAERARDGDSDSFEKTFAHLVNERRRSVVFDFADWEDAHVIIEEEGAFGAGGKGVDQDPGAAELGDNGPESTYEGTNGSSISRGSLA